MPKLKLFALALLVLCGCTTSSRFVLPPGTQLEVGGRLVTPDAEGMVETRPFFWHTAGGIPYRVLDGNTVVKQGKLTSSFRVVSIFWPPYAIIYWPMGFREEVYDLTGEGENPSGGS